MTDNQITAFNNSGYAYSPVGIVYYSGVYVAKYYIVPNDNQSNMLVIVDSDGMYYTHDINMSVKDSLNIVLCTEQIGNTWVPTDLRSYSVYGDGLYTYSLVLDYPFLNSTWEDVRRDLFTVEFNLVDLRNMTLEDNALQQEMHETMHESTPNNDGYEADSDSDSDSYSDSEGSSHTACTDIDNAGIDNAETDNTETISTSDESDNDSCECGLNLADDNESIVVVENINNNGKSLTYIFTLEDYLALKVLCPELDLSNIEDSIEEYRNNNQINKQSSKHSSSKHNSSKHSSSKHSSSKHSSSKPTNSNNNNMAVRRSERLKKQSLRRSERLSQKSKIFA